MDILKLLFLSSAIFLLTLGIASANELNDTDVLTLQSDYGSFNELQDLIKDSPKNSAINLTNDYFSDNNDFSNGIEIDKPLTINGNNHIIDANYNSRIFKISSSGVVLNNIKFVNGKTASNGGAVRFDHGGEINNCIFENNAANCGGAVYIDNYENIKKYSIITNSTFIDNSADDVGGAIHQFVNCKVYDSTFVNNNANYGGAVYQFDNCNIYNSAFINNSATLNSKGNSGGYGGAIYQYESSVYNSDFINNSAHWCGGAIYQQDGSKVYDSNFVNNSADMGGAIYQRNGSMVYNSNFVNNSADHGGAIYQEDGSKVFNSTFEDNHANHNCSDICDSLNCTKNSSSDTKVKSDNMANNDFDIIHADNGNETGNPLGLLILCSIVFLTRVKR